MISYSLFPTAIELGAGASGLHRGRCAAAQECLRCSMAEGCPTERVAEGNGSYLTVREQIPPPAQFIDDDDSYHFLLFGQVCFHHSRSTCGL